MDEKRLEKLIEETLSTMDPVEVPKDLHFDAAKIMRLAKMEEEAEAERNPAPVPFMERVRQAFRSRSMVRYAAAAAAFVVLLGVYGVWKSGSVPAPLPGNDPSQTAEIDDPEIPAALPENPVGEDDPVQNEDPVIPDTPDEPPAEEVPAVTPQPPTQTADNPKPPAVTPPAPKPPETTEEPQIEEEPTDVTPGEEYAGGNEVDPEEQIPDGETPAAPPEEQTGEEPADPEENEFELLLEEALQDEAFAADFAAEDKGFGHNVVDVQDVPEGTEFMVYFYESEEEQLAGTVNEDDIRSILWKKESL